MKTTMVMATLALLGGMAAADDLNGDIPPQPSAMGNAVAETFNAIKHATVDVLHQEQTDRNQMLKLSKSLEQRLTTLRQQKGAIAKLQKEQLKASVEAQRTAKGDDEKVQKAKELKQASDDLKQADADLTKAEGIVSKMKTKVDGLGKEKNPVALNKDWAALRTAMQADNKVLMNLATSATAKIASADSSIAKHKGSSTSSASDAAGDFKVTLKSWSCKKTELYVNDTKVFGKDAAKGAVNIGKDGSFKLRAMIVDPRREQARTFIGTKQKGSITISAASEYILSYSNGTKATDWRVAKEEYEWQKVEGNNVEGKPASSGATAKNDVLAIIYPTNAMTNNLHGWVRAEISWKGAQNEDATENCSYDLNLAPAK